MFHCGAVLIIALIVVPCSKGSETVDVDGYVYCPHLTSSSEEGDDEIPAWFAGKDPEEIAPMRAALVHKPLAPFLPAKGATIQLFNKDDKPFFGDDLLATAFSDEEGHFRIVGVTNYWFFSVNPYVIVAYSCPRPASGYKECTYVSKVWINWQGSYTKKTILIPGAGSQQIPNCV